LLRQLVRRHPVGVVADRNAAGDLDPPDRTRGQVLRVQDEELGLLTPIIADDKGRQIQNGRYVFNPTYSQNLNSGRLKPYHRLDVRIDHFINYSWGFGNIFVEMLNVYLRDNPVNMSWNQARPISRTNPSIQNDFGTLESSTGDGKKIKFPLINFGLEVQF
ncbi:MAG TPA: hypothetical protein PLB73_15690, partial [Leptospiraceae bacterium]|nr:hypothetical protein [Leptospiraceae bacterium]